MKSTTVGVIGAGPAGLTAAWQLAKGGARVVVFEADPNYVGGIARTVEYRGFRFDIGGHRFFSKSQEVEDLWTELLGDEMLLRPRSSRIFYGGKFYSYPLRAAEAFWNLGVWETARCLLSYAWSKLLPIRPARSFEDWVSNQFGRRLFQIFFKTYTEKVWGMSCREISADWAAQRIKGLSLARAIWSALVPARKNQQRADTVKTLIDQFRYPRLGPGMMWDAAAKRTRALGGEVRLGTRVTSLERIAATGKWRVNYRTEAGEESAAEFDHVISSAPLRELMEGIKPAVSVAALQSARSLRYRDFLTVALMVRPRQPFADNWIYIHDPSVKVGRVQNFGSWSPAMVPDPELACYGLEYFCFEGDGLWASPDQSLIELASRELQQLGLVAAGDVMDGAVVRQPKAYPVYDDHYADHVQVIRDELQQHYPHLHLVGRNGMHKYNNQDHSMMTALLVARNILAGETLYDVWCVNQDAEYHEEKMVGEDQTGRQIPRALAKSSSS